MFITGIRKAGVFALGGVMALALAACGDDNGGEATGGGETNGGGGGGGETITLGWLPSWTDGRSVGTLVQHQLEEMGYNVEVQTLSEAGPLYTAVAQGDIDMYPSAWPQITHASYMETYGDDLESLGAYYDNAVLTWAVPEYSEIQSIEDIPEYADVLGNRIVGIEPGAGLTEASQDDVIPTYGLEDFELVTSSTAAMLTELENAINNEEEIVVTLWRPFWANETYNMRDLEDPQDAFGDAETLEFIAHAGFAEEYPDVAEYLDQLKLDDEQYGTLESTVVNDFAEGEEMEAIEQWISDNPDVLPELPQS